MNYITVDGTHEADNPHKWSLPTSRWSAAMARFGHTPLDVDNPYEWDTALDGINGQNTAWRIGGKHLYHHLVPPRCPDRRVPPEDTLIIAFSHGVNLALHAFAYGLKGRLISVNPPIRRDLRPTIAAARPNLIRWVNLYGDWRDWWAVLGGVFDGGVSIRRAYPENNDLEGKPDAQFLVPGGHGAALKDQTHFVSWQMWMDEVRKQGSQP
jgi:hypothetical protein